MVQLRIETGEIASLERLFDAADGDARRKARDAVRKSTFEIERGAKTRAAVDTGFMRNSISTAFTGDVYSDGYTGEVGPGAYYAPYVEFGTDRMAPQPFLGPAYDAVEPSFLAAMRRINPLNPGGAGV